VVQEHAIGEILGVLSSMGLERKLSGFPKRSFPIDFRVTLVSDMVFQSFRLLDHFQYEMWSRNSDEFLIERVRQQWNALVSSEPVQRASQSPDISFLKASTP
jgi:hypothetical protein